MNEENIDGEILNSLTQCAKSAKDFVKTYSKLKSTFNTFSDRTKKLEETENTITVTMSKLNNQLDSFQTDMNLMPEVSAKIEEISKVVKKSGDTISSAMENIEPYTKELDTIHELTDTINKFMTCFADFSQEKFDNSLQETKDNFKSISDFYDNCKTDMRNQVTEYKKEIRKLKKDLKDNVEETAAIVKENKENYTKLYDENLKVAAKIKQFNKQYVEIVKAEFQHSSEKIETQLERSLDTKLYSGIIKKFNNYEKKVEEFNHTIIAIENKISENVLSKKRYLDQVVRHQENENQSILEQLDDKLEDFQKKVIKKINITNSKDNDEISAKYNTILEMIKQFKSQESETVIAIDTVEISNEIRKQLKEEMQENNNEVMAKMIELFEMNNTKKKLPELYSLKKLRELHKKFPFNTKSIDKENELYQIRKFNDDDKAEISIFVGEKKCKIDIEFDILEEKYLLI